MKKTILKLFIAWLVLMLLFVGGRTIGNMFPQEKISENVKKSIPYIQLYPMVGVKTDEWDVTTQLDGYTELYIISCALSSTGEHPLIEAVGNPVVSDGGDDWLERVDMLTQKGKNEIQEIEKSNKITYWWGILSILRPLLSVMSYAFAIRVMQLIFMICLFLCSWLLAKKVNLVSAILFVIGLWSVNTYIASMSFYFSSTFITMMCACIYILLSKKIYDNYICAFWIIGIITPYFDQFSATSLIITIPLTVFLLLYNKKEELSYKKAFKIGFMSSFMWGCGYFVSLVSKWGIAAILGLADWNLVLERVKASGTNPNLDWIPSNSVDLAKFAITENYSKINFIMLANSSKFMKGFLIFIICIVILLLVLFHKKVQGIIPVLCIIAVIPVMWYIVFKGHTAIHCWFTYRHTLASVWCALLCVYYLFDFEKFKNTIKKIKKN